MAVNPVEVIGNQLLQIANMDQEIQRLRRVESDQIKRAEKAEKDVADAKQALDNEHGAQMEIQNMLKNEIARLKENQSRLEAEVAAFKAQPVALPAGAKLIPESARTHGPVLEILREGSDPSIITGITERDS